MKNLKSSLTYRVLPLLGLFVAVTLLVAGCSTDNSEQGEPTLRVGVILPTTGDAAYIGQSIKNGMQLAIDEFNEADTTNSFDLEVEFSDNQSSSSQVVTNYQRLASTLDPQAVIGVQQGLRSLVPLAQEDERVLLATSVPDNGIAEANPWSFRFFINAKTDASTIAEYAYDELGVRRAAVIYVNDNMGNSYHTEFEDSFEGFGGQLVASETFSPGQANHRTQIQKIKQANPGAVYLVGYGKSLSTLPGQLREANVDATLLSVGTVSQPEIMKAAGEAANGIYYTTSKFSTYNPQNPELKRFVSRYKERHGETPVFFEVFGYDSLRLLLMAARQGGVQPEELRKGLTNIKDASLAVGDVSVAKDQDVRFPVVVRRIMDGEWVPVEQSEESKETAQQTSE